MAERRFNLDDYVGVHERLEAFRTDHPTWALSCEILEDDGTRVLMRAVVCDETDRVLAVGHAEEIRGEGQVNKTSTIENAETSAWGRALANLGYHVKRGIASREEMRKANGEDSDQRDWFERNGWESQLVHDTWRAKATAVLKKDAELRKRFTDWRVKAGIDSFSDAVHSAGDANKIQAWLEEETAGDSQRDPECQHLDTDEADGRRFCVACGSAV